MNKIPFNVSARTARLIGRENISNSEGAIIELVKNSYDADASLCLIIFKNPFKSIPEKLTATQYISISNQNGFQDIKDCYEKIDDGFNLKLLIGDKKNKLEEFFNSFCEIYIADNGSGMGEATLKNQWMTIGTDNKLEAFRSKKNRIQTGAKGIGRFALDRLGSYCEVLTKPEDSKDGFSLRVNWEDFEKKNEIINNVYADLTVKKSLDLKKELSAAFNSNENLPSELLNQFNQGTILKISKLRDPWNTENVKNIYKVLESLTPPGVFKEFKMFVVDSSDMNNFGEVKNFINEDYDYFLNAVFNADKKLIITIHRREFDFSKIDKRLFELDSMKEYPYKESDFKKGNFLKELTIDQLIPGGINDYLINQLGPFEFNLYFIKRQTTEEDKEKFFFREFNTYNRSEWIKRSGGIKLFRDNFRVRPYGEPGGSSYDWLGLDARAASSPAGFAQRLGQWRVRNQQVAGEVNISRITNLNFDDKSSREGLQENIYFKLFKNILIEIVSLFERDREYIGINMKKLSRIVDEEEKTKDEALNIVNEMESSVDTPGLFSAQDTNVDTLKKRLETVAKGYKIKEKEQEELLTEMKMLRTLASSGLLIATFAHELIQLGGTLSRRVNLLKLSLDEVIDKQKLSGLPSYKDPYRRLQRIEEDDSKLKSWIELSINALQKNKRNKISVNIHNYLKDYIEEINNVVKLKMAKCELKSKNEVLKIKAFPLDLDSIFNNLIANSITAFLRDDAPVERLISIDLLEEEYFVVVDYSDSGPGLDKSIPYPSKIFELFFTTKIDEKTGNKIGTGLGLWIVKSIMEEYGGKIELSKVISGFSLKLFFPKK